MKWKFFRKTFHTTWLVGNIYRQWFKKECWISFPFLLYGPRIFPDKKMESTVKRKMSLGTFLWYYDRTFCHIWTTMCTEYGTQCVYQGQENLIFKNLFGMMTEWSPTFLLKHSETMKWSESSFRRHSIQLDLWVTHTDSDVRKNVESHFNSPSTQWTITHLKCTYISWLHYHQMLLHGSVLKNEPHVDTERYFTQNIFYKSQ
jgi:hypothetical protein